MDRKKEIEREIMERRGKIDELKMEIDALEGDLEDIEKAKKGGS